MACDFYPMLCVDNVAETVNFYEDYFDFVPVYEDESFVKLQLNNNPAVLLTIVATTHPDLPEESRQITRNVILNFPVEDINKKYDELYLEGLPVHSRPTIDSCGYPHFFVCDPNGNLIDIMQKDFQIGKEHNQYAATADSADEIVFV